MRINLPENFDYKEVYEWFNANVGEQEEHVTWFWSSRLYEAEDFYGNKYMAAQEGVEMWNTDSHIHLLAALRWN